LLQKEFAANAHTNLWQPRESFATNFPSTPAYRASCVRNIPRNFLRSQTAAASSWTRPEDSPRNVDQSGSPMRLYRLQPFHETRRAAHSHRGISRILCTRLPIGACRPPLGPTSSVQRCLVATCSPECGSLGWATSALSRRVQLGRPRPRLAASSTAALSKHWHNYLCKLSEPTLEHIFDIKAPQ
jgi:hypothetical protein